ncbi:hypothetical protein ACOMHN_067172 [Nucella lapillus]
MSTAHHRAQMMMSLVPDQFEELIISHISRRIELNDGKLDELMNGVSKSKSSIASITRASLRRIASPLKVTKSKSVEKDSAGLEICSQVVGIISKLMVSLSSASELRVEGVFRKSGNCARVKELKQKLLDDCGLDLTPYTTHDRAAVIKNLLSDLSEPLLLSKHLEAFRQAVALGSNGMETGRQRCLRVIQLLMLHLPRNNLLIARRLLGLLSSVAAEGANKMDSAGLATLFAPHLLCSKQVQSDAILFNCALSPATAAVKFMIENSGKLFQIPAEFVRDVNQFLQSEDRVCDNVNGVCTPVSTESDLCRSPISAKLSARSASESGKDTTELELAKLQAHIQSLSGCQKRKLSKQLNDVTVIRAAEGSSQGTPQKYQGTPQRKHFRSKSLGSSIRDIDFESTPSKNVMVVDCRPLKAPPSAALDEDATPPKVAHMEPKEAVTLPTSPDGAGTKKRDTAVRTKEGKQEKPMSPLPLTENEREYLVVSGPQGKVLSQVQHSTVPDSAMTCGEQEIPQQCRGRSRERRCVKSAAMSSPLSVETSL